MKWKHFSLFISYLAIVGYVLCQDDDLGANDLDGINELSDDPCAYTTCAQGSQCVVENGRARCKCNEFCNKIYRPVCGTDGNTYSNQCVLDVHNCENNDNIGVDHDGECNECGAPDMAIADN